jgi:nucleoside-diphosphate-sugar epimerase
MSIAKECGVKKSVVLGSYFSYFAKKFPEMELTKKHPYIRSRIAQEETALKFAEDGKMDVAVLELPYIFGTQPGRKPVWVILVEQIANMPKVTMYPKGGTTMVTVRQVSECIVGAAAKTKGGVAYPIGYYNLTWDELLNIVHEEMGFKGRKIIHIPKWTFRLYGKKMLKDYAEKKLEPGLNPIDLADIMGMNAFIDKKWAVMLGATEDDIEAAIRDSIALSVEAMRGKELVGMKAE